MTKAAPPRGVSPVAAVALALPVAVFATLAWLLEDGRRLQPWDEALSRAVGQHTPAAMRSVFGVLTHFGEPLLLWALGAVVTLALLLRRHRGLAAIWVVALLGNGVLTRLLKLVFARSRPLIDGLPGPASGYSFPSGHSSASIVAYTLLAYLGWRLLVPRWHAPLVVAAVAIALTVACSRVFLQVHYASDVLAGLCSGGAWAALCIAAAEYLRQRHSQA
jgi:undecaprenyl-diphosphatase